MALIRRDVMALHSFSSLLTLCTSTTASYAHTCFGKYKADNQGACGTGTVLLFVRVHAPVLARIQVMGMLLLLITNT